MKLEAVLFAAILASVAAPAAAEETGAKSQVKGSSPVEEKADPPTGEHKLDFKELFGCEPMGEEGHKPASGGSQQETMQPAQERGQMREQR